MGVKYERMNGSAFRAARRRARENPSAQVTITAAGTRVTDHTWGAGITLDDGVATTDRVRVEFAAGVLEFPHSAVLAMRHTAS